DVHGLRQQGGGKSGRPLVAVEVGGRRSAGEESEGEGQRWPAEESHGRCPPSRQLAGMEQAGKIGSGGIVAGGRRECKGLSCRENALGGVPPDRNATEAFPTGSLRRCLNAGLRLRLGSATDVELDRAERLLVAL